MHYYQFHIGDYRAATAHLTNEEDLAYRRLLDWYYDTETPIKFDQIQHIARRIRIDPAVMQQVLSDMFIKQDDCWINKRADADILEYHQKLEKASRAGKASAVQRTFNGCSTDVQPTINHKPLTINHKPNIECPDGVSITVWNDFLQLRKSKKAALTVTALKGFIREAKKAGIPLEDVFSICCERAWIGFKADWIKENWRSNAAPSPQLAAARTIFGDERVLTNGIKTIT